MSNVYKCFVLIYFLDGAAAIGFLSVFTVLLCDYNSCQNNYLRLRRLWWLSFKVLCIIGNYWKLVNVRIGADIILLSRIVVLCVCRGSDIFKFSFTFLEINYIINKLILNFHAV